MPRKLPPLHALTAFEVAAKYGSFSRAAEELALTHGAISHKIKQLEDYLGVRLFVRLPRNVLITNEGSSFLSEVQAALSLLEAASARVAKREHQRALRVNVLPPFAGNFLVRQLPDFLQQHPEIDLVIDATPRLENNDLAGIDVFIRYGKGEWAGFESVKLMDVELYPVCSPGFLEKHPFLDRPTQLAKVVLLRHTMEPWEPWFDGAGVSAAAAPAGPLFTDARLMLDAAREGQGVALARSVLAESDIRQGRLVRLFDVSVRSPCAYYAFFPMSARSRPEISAFVDWLVGICTEASI